MTNLKFVGETHEGSSPSSPTVIQHEYPFKDIHVGIVAKRDLKGGLSRKAREPGQEVLNERKRSAARI